MRCRPAVALLAAAGVGTALGGAAGLLRPGQTGRALDDFEPADRAGSQQVASAARRPGAGRSSEVPGRDAGEQAPLDAAVVRSATEGTAAGLRALRGLPAYPGAAAAPLFEQPRGWGGELSLAWFATADSPEQVLRHYQAAFAAGGAVPAMHRFDSTLGYLAAMQSAERGERLRLVVAMQQAAGQTLVFISENDPVQLVERRLFESPPGWEWPPGTRGAVRFAVGESGDSAWLARASGAELGAVSEFYRLVLGRAGWQLELAAEPEPGTAQLSARRAGHRATVTLRPSSSGEVDILVVLGESA